MSNRQWIAIILAPIALVVVVLTQSPNFDVSEIDREAPLGSDFLQEYVGGFIIGSSNAERLYDSRYSLTVQHDVDVVGFTFPQSDYYPMVYPPFYYAFLSPLTHFSYPVAMRLWMMGLGFCISAFAWIITKYFPPLEHHRVSSLVAIIAFAPLFVSLTMAHKSVILLLILGATYVLLHHSKPYSAGLVFGLIAFKPHLAIPIGLAMLCKKQWRFVTGAAATVAILVACCFVRGPIPCVDYFWQCTGMGDYVHTGGYKLAEAHGISGAVRLMVDEATNPRLVNWLSKILQLAVLVIIVVGLRGSLDTTSVRFAVQFSMLVVATALLSPHFYYYDLTILLLPILLIGTMGAGEWGREFSDLQRRGLLVFAVSLFLTAGFFTRLAQLSGFQLSLFLLLGLLGWSLGCLLRSGERYGDELPPVELPPTKLSGKKQAISF